MYFTIYDKLNKRNVSSETEAARYPFSEKGLI